MTRRVAIVPARGGSKRIPQKNIRDFCGKPMIGYVLDAARASGLFDVVHVSTESQRIRDTVESLGFEVDFMRPDRLADDLTPIWPVLKFVLATYAERQQHFDQVWLLMACAPFVEASDLKAAADMLRRSGRGSSVMAVAPYPVAIERAYRRAADGMLTPVQPGLFAVRSQDLEKAYFDAGMFAAMPAATVLASQGAGSNTGFLGYVLERDKAIDIDDESDWALAESLFYHRSRIARSSGATKTA